MWQFESHEEADTERFGAALAAAVPDGTTIGLTGTLGAGKTRLVQALAAACGVDRESVVSPTFVLCQQYHGKRVVNHLDLYRVGDADEFAELGPEEYFESDAITCVEWADRFAEWLPPDRLDIQIEWVDDRRRRITSAVRGRLSEEIVERLRALLDDV